MNSFRRYGAVALSAVLLLSALGGCAKTETPDDSKEPGTSTTEPGTTVEPTTTFDIEGMSDPIVTLMNMDGDTVVATANGIEVTAADYLYQVAYTCDGLLSQYSSYGITEVPWDQAIGDETFKDVIAHDALQTAALYAMMPDKAKSMGIEMDADTLAELDTAIEGMIAEMGGEEITNYNLWAGPITMEQYRDTLVMQNYYSMIYDFYNNEGGEFYATDEECLAYAEEQGIYNSKHILLKTVSDTMNETMDGYLPLSDEEIAAQKAQIEDIMAQLKASNEPLVLFDELMNEYSEDGRNPETNELYSPDGYVAYSGQMVPEFEAAALALEPNTISEIVESDYGYHIILRLPLEMTSSYRDGMAGDKMIAWQNQWLDESDIQANDKMADLDVQLFYENLSAFRVQMDGVLKEMTADESTEAAD